MNKHFSFTKTRKVVFFLIFLFLLLLFIDFLDLKLSFINTAHCAPNPTDSNLGMDCKFKTDFFGNVQYHKKTGEPLQECRYSD
jgi:hypothetical protein